MIPLATSHVDVGELMIVLGCLIFIGFAVAGIIYRIDPMKKRKIEEEKLESDIISLEKKLDGIKKAEEDILR